ncbi:MAG: hypothetical protein AAF580_14690 [Pseudomonadota bacterium]
MSNPAETAHAEHLSQVQDHYRWRHDHLEALSILKRAEAAIFAYQARIMAHEAEITQHAEHIAHAEAPNHAEHAHFAKAHAHEHNDALIEAIRALAPHLEQKTQP